MTTTYILGILVLKHFIVDALLQTKYQYSNKGKYGHFGGILHAALHGIGTFLVMSLCLIYPPFYTCVVIGLLDFVIHYHIDWGKMNITKNYSAMTQDVTGTTCLCIYNNKFFIWCVADQCLHFATYIGLTHLTYQLL